MTQQKAEETKDLNISKECQCTHLRAILAMRLNELNLRMKEIESKYQGSIISNYDNERETQRAYWWAMEKMDQMAHEFNYLEKEVSVVKNILKDKNVDLTAIAKIKKSKKAETLRKQEFLDKVYEEYKESYEHSDRDTSGQV